MKPIRHFASIVLLSALGITASLPVQSQETPAANATTQSGMQLASDSVKQSLAAAQELFKAKKYEEALAKLRLLDAMPNKTAVDQLLIERTRIAVASASGNTALLNQSLETAMKFDQLTAEDKIKFSEALAQSYYNAKDYPKSIDWLSRYFKEGGKDSSMREYFALSYYFSNDFHRAAEEINAGIQAAEAAGKMPSESQLRLLASCGKKLNDNAMRAGAIEKFVAYYPKKEHWADLLTTVLSKPGFPDQLTLDVYRLMHATGQVNTAKDYVEMSQLAMVSGYPVEAEKILNEGFQSGVLGKGTDSAKHKQLLDAAAKSVATETKTLPAKESEYEQGKKATGLVDIGFAYVERGQYDKGIDMMEQGIRMGGLKRPELSKLHLGVAYVLADQKAKAIDTFKSVRGTDGTEDIARYWTMHLSPRNG